MNLTICNRFRLEEPLECGREIMAYRAIDMMSDEAVTVKILKDPRKMEKFFTESRALKALAGHPGFPQLFYESNIKNSSKTSTNSGPSTIFVICLSYFGEEVDIMKQYQREKRKLPTLFVLHLSIGLLSRLEIVHRSGIIHNNINPNNICVLGDDLSVINSFDESFYDYIILNDFSSATFSKGNDYFSQNPGNANQQPQSKHNRKYTGAFKYSSINAHYGRTLTPNDDLESLAYSLIYLAKGKLPWSGAVEIQDRAAKNSYYLKMKQKNTVETLCEGLPEAFSVFLSRVKSLKVGDIPDYAGYRAAFSASIQAYKVAKHNMNSQSIRNKQYKRNSESHAGNEITSLSNAPNFDLNQPNLQQNINQNHQNINQNHQNINQNHQNMNQNQLNMNQNGESEFPNHCFVNASQSNLPPHISNVFPQNAELLQASKSHGSGDSMISASTSNPAAIAARQALLSLRQVNSVNPPACPLPLPSSSSAGIGCSAGVANSKLPLLKPGNSSHIYGMGVPGNDPKITQRKSMPLINNIAMIHTGGVIHEERAGKAKRVEFNMNKRTNILLKTTAVPKS